MNKEEGRIELALHWLLCKLFKRRDIVIDGELYLRRWFLTPRSWPIRVFLHCIRRPDQQNDLHDHPWDFHTFILARGYREKCGILRRDGTRVFQGLFTSVTAKPFRLLSRKAEHSHAVAPISGPAWTLVFAKKARRTWGFHTDKGWVDWRTYLGLPPDTKDHPEDLV